MENIRELFQIMTRRFGILNKNCCSIENVEISTIHSHILYEIERRQNPSMQELATALGTDITTFSRQVQSLLKMELIEKTPHHQDRRVQLLSLTAKGNQISAIIDQQVQANLNEVFSYLSEEERKMVIDSIKLLNSALSKSSSCCQLKMF